MLFLLLIALNLALANAVPVEMPWSQSKPASVDTVQTANNTLLPVDYIVKATGIRFENLAVRSNGQILTTSSQPNASIYQVDPLGILPITLIHTIPNVTSAAGIVEAEEDVFYVVSGDISLQDPFKTTPSSYSVTKLDVRGVFVFPNGTLSQKPKAQRVASMPNASIPNGAALAGPKSDNMLVADSIRGLIYNVNVSSGAVGITLNDTTTKGCAPTGMNYTGINGLKVHNGTMYWTVTGCATLYKVDVDTQGKIPTGVKPTLVTSNLTCDDLVIDNFGNAFVAGTENVITKVSPSGEKQIIAGTFNSTMSSLGGPTALRFGRMVSDQWSLYVTQNGGLFAPIPSLEGVARIDLRQR